MRSKLLPLFVIVAATVMAFAQTSQQPYSVKGDRLGETLSEWSNNNPSADRCDETVLDLPRDADHSWLAYCLTRGPKQSDTFTYGTAQLRTQSAWFHNGKLYKVEMSFLNNESVPELLAGLKQKFGRPSSKQTSHLQNGFGSQFEEKRIRWTNKVSMLELVYSTVPGNYLRLTFTLDVPKGEAQWKRQQTMRACADM
jgi:hypothetical protein